MNAFGFLRVSCVTPRVSVADPLANLKAILQALDLTAVRDSDVVVFPELCITSYTCADLFLQTTLQEATVFAVHELARAMAARPQLIVVGLPVAHENSLYNCAAAVHGGKVLGIVPKQFIPNYKEFYESRWFSGARGGEPSEIDFGGTRVPFGIDLLFEAGKAVVGIEICEDLWMPIPPSSFQAIAGANVLVNVSASNETIGKSAYRRDLVVGQSGRCIAAYAYSSAGPTESTTDLVFGGHCLIAENGSLVKESPRVGDGQPLNRETYAITADVDLQRLQSDRQFTTSFDDCVRHLPAPYRRIPFTLRTAMTGLQRTVPATPFVPQANAELHRRCAEIFGIQQSALAKRLERVSGSLNIGVSGGLDSTLALLAAVKTCDLLGRDRTTVRGLTMPGFGTTPETQRNAVDLMQHLKISHETIDIRELCLESFRALSHSPFGIDCTKLTVSQLQSQLQQLPDDKRTDLVFENVQARLRTFLLMSRGFVLGTGDLSESALGWSTYNGDHMSMYNPNGSIPKTLVRFLVEYVAEHEFSGAVRDTLLSIAQTPISPELLPLSAEGKIAQSTEQSLGPYELHDFFLYHFIRGGCSPEKILFLSRSAKFSVPYSREQIASVLRTFYRRFFSNQFKRTCVPDGPKVGSVSLSPRGDWRMPTDAEATLWLKSLE